MTLKQLEAFYWAATCINFSVAARRLHLSISSLSKRITELETSLGQPLFDRSGHKAALTGAGVQLVPRARELLQAADALRADIAAAPAGALRGDCRIGVGELTALTWLPRLAAAVRQAHPGLSVQCHVDIGERLEQRVESGELDCAVVAGQSSRSAIASEPIAQALFAWCVAAGTPGPARQPVARLLQDLPLVGLPQGSGITRLVGDWLRAASVFPARRMEINHWGAVAGLLAGGLGVGVLPLAWARSLAGRGALRLLEASPPLPALTYCIQWRRDDARPLVAALRALAGQSADFSKTSGVL